MYNEVQTVEYETAQMLWREGTSFSFSSPLLLCKRLYDSFLCREALSLSSCSPRGSFQALADGEHLCAGYGSDEPFGRAGHPSVRGGYRSRRSTATAYARNACYANRATAALSARQKGRAQIHLRCRRRRICPRHTSTHAAHLLPHWSSHQRLRMTSATQG